MTDLEHIAALDPPSSASPDCVGESKDSAANAVEATAILFAFGRVEFRKVED